MYTLFPSYDRDFVWVREKIYPNQSMLEIGRNRLLILPGGGEVWSDSRGRIGGEILESGECGGKPSVRLESIGRQLEFGPKFRNQ